MRVPHVSLLDFAGTRPGDPKKYTARVIAVGHECDLALLTTDAPEFWEGTTALELGGIPNLQDPVAVVGYPTGGDNISVSVGVVSRVEPQVSSWSLILTAAGTVAANYSLYYLCCSQVSS